MNNYVQINKQKERRKLLSEGLSVFTRMTLETDYRTEEVRSITKTCFQQQALQRKSALVIENYVEEQKAKQCFCSGVRSLKQMGTKLQ